MLPPKQINGLSDTLSTEVSTDSKQEDVFDELKIATEKSAASLLSANLSTVEDTVKALMENTPELKAKIEEFAPNITPETLVDMNQEAIEKLLAIMDVHNKGGSDQEFQENLKDLSEKIGVDIPNDLENIIKEALKEENGLTLENLQNLKNSTEVESSEPKNPSATPIDLDRIQSVDEISK